MHILIGIVAVFVLLIILSAFGKAQQNKAEIAARPARAQKMIDEARKFFDQIEYDGAIPEVEALHLNLQSGEFVTLRESPVKLAGFRTVHVAVDDRGREKPPQLGFGPAKWEERRASTVSLLGTGDLYLTNSRLIFLSGDQDISISAKSVYAMKASFISFNLSSKESPTPLHFIVKNPIIWTLMLKWASSGQLKSAKLDPGTHFHLDASAGDDEWKLDFSMRSDDTKTPSAR